MKKTAYTIQIIPETSKKIKYFRVSKLGLRTIQTFIIVLLLMLLFTVYKLASINIMLLNYPKLKLMNKALIEKHKEYQQEFEQLDSIYLMDAKIKILLGTYFESDTQKINTIIQENRFNFKPNNSNIINFEGIYGWSTYEEKIKIEKIPNILPVIGIVSKKYSDSTKHYGVDFAGQIGDPIFATASGKIVFADKKDELGLTLDIDHGNGYISSYSHLKSIRKKRGNFVKKGEIIGYIGNTGKTSGPHLHYAITKDGIFVNPELYFNN